MCENNTVLILFLILKIVLFIGLPLLILLTRKISFQKSRIIFIVDAILIVLFIALRISNNDCICNSTINGIRINTHKYSSEYVEENNDPNEVNRIVTNKIYQTNNNRSVFYFNNNQLPLSNKKITCDNKEVYMKNYGSGITATSIAVSSLLGQNIDPIEILDLSKERGIIDCDEGIDLNDILFVSSIKYDFESYAINSNEVPYEVLSGNVLLAEVNYVPGAKNITCDTGYIIIYNVDNEGNYYILNPNESSKEYICPDSSKGYLTVINANLSSELWTFNELNTIVTRYIKFERR